MSCKIMMSAEFCNYIYNSFSVIVYLWNVILNMDITLLLNKSGGLDAMPLFLLDNLLKRKKNECKKYFLI